MFLPRLIKRIDILHLAWIRWLVCLGVLGLSAIAYQLTNRLPVTYLIGAIMGAIFILIAMRNMILAITIMLLVSSTSGVVIGTGRATPIPA